MSQGNREVLADGNVRQQTMEQHPHLSLSHRNAVDTVLTSRDQMTALEGVAGAGKTTSLAAVRDAAVSAGYEVEGLAPTSRAAQKLGEAGKRAPALKVSTHVSQDSPKEEIVEQAERWHADLVIVGSHGHGPLGRFLLGSVASSVAIHAPCSVEIVRRRRD